MHTMEGKNMQNIKTQAKLLYRWVFFKMLIPVVYLLGSLRRINPEKILFVEHHYPEISNSNLVMYQTLLSQYTFSVERCHLLANEGGKWGRAGRLLRGAWQAADARLIFLCESSHLISALPLRKGTTVVQLFHACGPFKKFGFSTAGRLFGDTKKNMLRFHANRNYTFVTVASEAAIPPFAEAMCLVGQEEKILPIGVSRTDIFFQADFHEAARQKLLSVFPQAAGKRVLLYAPTYRGNAYDAATADALDIGAFYEAFAADSVLLLKNHPITRHRPQIAPAFSDFAADVSQEMSIEELISVASVCITDYSSWIFEAALLERPMAFFPHDIETYHDWHGFYQPYEDFVPGPIGRDTGELIEAVREALGEPWRQQVRAFRKKYMDTCDGHATQRILLRALGEETLAAHRKDGQEALR